MTKTPFAPVLFWVLAPLAPLQDRFYSALSAEAFMIMGLFGAIGSVLCVIAAKIGLARGFMLISILLFAAMTMPAPRILTPYLIAAVFAWGWVVSKRAGDAFLYVAIVFAVFFTVSGAVTNASRPDDFVYRPATQTDHINPALETAYVHLIFDELASTEAARDTIPTGNPASTFVERLKARNLTVYPTVRSNFSYTHLSLGQMLAVDETREVDATWSASSRPEFVYEISENSLFDALTRHGYEQTVFQSTYLDFCGTNAQLTCHTSNYFDMNVFNDHPLAARGEIAYRGLYATFMNHNNDRFWPALRNAWLELGAPFSVSNILAMPVTAFEQWSKIVEHIQGIQPGQSVFAHILLPHYPHAFDQNCIEKPVSQWGHLKAHSPTVSDEEMNLKYWEQFECMTSQVLAVIDDIQASKPYVTFVIHGDHGKRLYKNFGDKENLSDMLDTMVFTNAQNAPQADSTNDLPILQVLVPALIQNAVSP